MIYPEAEKKKLLLGKPLLASSILFSAAVLRNQSCRLFVFTQNRNNLMKYGGMRVLKLPGYTA